MKTKDEIISNIESYSPWGDMPTKQGDYILESELEGAMDEYAKELSIGFAEWIGENYIPPLLNSTIWYPVKKDVNEGLSTDQLFSIYLDSLK